MNVFRRVEQKYILTEEEFKDLFQDIKDFIEKDKYFKSTICNIYLDGVNNELIVNSLEKPSYKEKVRVRSYVIPDIDDEVFLELKGKFQGVVYKRRLPMKLSEFYKYIETGNKPYLNNQIMDEIDYVIKKNKLEPKLFLAYDRLSFYDKNNKDFRITFDTNLRSRKDNLLLEYGDAGKLYSKDKFYIMELKAMDALPLWFVNILSRNNIYPTSFSKYGNIYKRERMIDYV